MQSFETPTLHPMPLAVKTWERANPDSASPFAAAKRGNGCLPIAVDAYSKVDEAKPVGKSSVDQWCYFLIRLVSPTYA